MAIQPREQDGKGNADDKASSAADKASETLSQFLASVLNQLSLSAWLPAGALVLGIALIISLGQVLDETASKDRSLIPTIAIWEAMARITSLGFGGGFVAVTSVIVLTIVTQAFSFEAIRILEGYWGTGRVAERIAKSRCAHHRRVQRRLMSRLNDETKNAWRAAQERIEAIQDEQLRLGGSPEFTRKMLAAKRAEVLGTGLVPKLPKAKRMVVADLDWESFSSPDHLRQMLNLDKRLRDYPESHRILPTRFGNILRAHEDETGCREVETFIQESFDRLPASLRMEHDDQRTRLDLYCSMIFVVLALISLTALRLVPAHWEYAAGLGLTGTLVMIMMYRAAIVSARAYGGILIVVAKYPVTEAK